MRGWLKKSIQWLQHHVVVCFAIGSILVTSVFFYDVILFNRTLLSTGVAAGITGDDGPYNFLKNVDQPEGGLGTTFAAFHKDLGAFPWQAEPHQIKNLDSIKNWSWPLWNEGNGVGKPQAANFISTPFFPLKLIIYLLPNSAGWDIYLMARFAVGLFFMAWFLRAMKLRAVPAFAGGVFFAFSGYFVLYQNITDMDVGLLAPIIFWAAAYTISLARSKKIHPFQYLALVGALASLMLANLPEPLILVLAAGGLFWLGLLVHVFFRDRPYFYKALKLSVQVVLPVFLIVLPQYLLNYELFKNSISVTHSIDAKAGLIAFSSDYILFYIFPYLHVSPYLLPLKPVSGQVQNYIGFGVFFLAVIGALTSLIKRNFGVGLLFLLLICVGKLYGEPIINQFIGVLPGFERVLFPKYIQPLISLAAAGLAAVGLQGLMSKTISKRELAFAVILVVCLVWIGLLMVFPFANDGWVENFVDILASNKKVFFEHLALLSVIAFFLIRKSTQKKLTNTLVVLLGLVVVLELWLLLPRHYPQRYDSFTPAPFVTYLQSQPEPFRIFGFDRLIFPELASAVQLEDIRVLDVLYIKQYYLYIKNFISPGIYDRFIGVAESSNELAPVQYINNPLFDLLNVKYILAKSPPLELFPDNEINTAIFAVNPPTPALRITAFVQNGDARKVLFEAAPTKACVTLPIAPDKPMLKFSTALDKNVWEYPGNDGVEFIIEDLAEQNLFSFIQNPAEKKADRQWIDHTVDLSRFAGQNLGLCFITDMRGNSAADYSGWADLRFVGQDGEVDEGDNQQYKLIYDGKVEMYENTHVYPRGFLVGSVAVVNEDESAVTAMKAADFDPRHQAVITQEKFASALPVLDGDACQAEITDYQRLNPNRVQFKVNSPGTCLLVFSESNYPGWVARVDGKTKPIHQTDLLLRGVFVDQGEHSVEFVYRPRTFYFGLIGTIIGLLLTGYWATKKKS